MRKISILFFCICLNSIVNAQSVPSDILLISSKSDSIPGPVKKSFTSLHQEERKSVLIKYNPVAITFSSLMFFYQRVLSPQIHAGCLFHPSCSEFGKQSIKEFGFVKGIFITADRIARCTKISAYDIQRLDISKDGRANDPAKKYRHLKR